MTSNQLSETQILGNRATEVIRDSIISPAGGGDTFLISGDNARLTIADSGSISDTGTTPGTAITVSGNNVLVDNRGRITSNLSVINIDGSRARLRNTGLVQSTGTNDVVVINGSLADAFSNRGEIGGSGNGIRINGTTRSINNENDGRINSNDNNGILITSDGRINGSINNSGSIRSRSASIRRDEITGEIVLADPSDIAAITIEGTLTGNIENRDDISATTGNGVIIRSGAIARDINNRRNGDIRSDINDGVEIDGTVRAINNEGTISSGDDGLDINSNGQVDTINNRQEGEILADGDGIELDGVIRIVNNQGTISGGGDGLDINTDGQVNTINNRRGSEISGDDNGIELSGTVRIINNEGTISGEDIGIDIRSSSEVNAINNRQGSRIFGRDRAGIEIDGTVGNINNQGTVLSENGIGIFLEQDSVVNGVINNLGTISSQNGSSIFAENLDSGITVDNSGTLNGDVVLGNGADSFDSSAGVVNGSIIGGDGDDRIIASRANDVIRGGEGNDTLTGGAGEDLFIYDADDIGQDTIIDFQSGVDRIDLRDIVAGDRQLQSILNNAQQFSNGTLRLDFGPNNGVFLRDTLIGDIDATDFLISPASPQQVLVNGTITGTEATETFVVENDAVLSGFPFIFDFQDGIDRIDLSQTSIRSFEEFSTVDGFVSSGVEGAVAGQTGNFLGTGQGGLVVYGDSLRGEQVFLSAEDFIFA